MKRPFRHFAFLRIVILPLFTFAVSCVRILDVLEDLEKENPSFLVTVDEDFSENQVAIQLPTSDMVLFDKEFDEEGCLWAYLCATSDSGIPDIGSATTFRFDKNLRPVAMHDAESVYLFEYKGDGDTCDMTVIQDDGEIYEYEDVDLTPEAIFTDAETKGWFDDTKQKCVDWLNGLQKGFKGDEATDKPDKEGKKPKKTTKAMVKRMAISAVIHRLLPDNGLGHTIALGVDLVELARGDLSAIWDAYNDGKRVGEDTARWLIGDCSIQITDVTAVGGGTVRITLAIYVPSGAHISTPAFRVNYGAANLFPNNQTMGRDVTTSGVYTAEADNLSPGEYQFEAIIYPSAIVDHPVLSNAVKIKSEKVYYTVPGLALSRLKTESVEYKEGAVHARFTAFLSWQDETFSSGIQTYGLMFKNKKDEKAYLIEGENLECSFRLSYPFDEFSLDWNSYTATRPFYLATYVTDKDGNTTISDYNRYAIIYDQAPELQLLSIESISDPYVTEVKELDDGTIEEHLMFIVYVNARFSGAFWVDFYQWDLFDAGNGWFVESNPERHVSADGELRLNFYSSPWSSTPMYHVSGWVLHLKNGTKMRSSQSIVMGGSPYSPRASIIGSSSSVPRKAVKQAPSKNPVILPEEMEGVPSLGGHR